MQAPPKGPSRTVQPVRACSSPACPTRRPGTRVIVRLDTSALRGLLRRFLRAALLGGRLLRRGGLLRAGLLRAPLRGGGLLRRRLLRGGRLLRRRSLLPRGSLLRGRSLLRRRRGLLRRR